MRSRIARLGMTATAVLGLLGVATPPAEALTVKTISFVLGATLNDGLSDPCFPVGHTPGLCPHPLENPGLLPQVNCLPLPELPPFDEIPNCHLENLGGNTRFYNFATVAGLCVTTGFNIDKLTKPLTHTPPSGCAIAGSGVVTGHCDFAGSQGTMDIIILGQVHTITYHFIDLGVVVYTGHVTKNTSGVTQHGLFIGLANWIAVPDPLPIGELHLPNNSCRNKTARNFTVPGTGRFVLTDS